MSRSAQLETIGRTALNPPPLPVLYSRVPDIVDRQGSRVLLVWGDIPHWAVVDAETFRFIEILQRGSTLHDVARTIAHASGHTICSTLHRLKKNLPDLVGAGVVYGSTPVEKPVAADSGIENITVNVTRRCNLSCVFCYNHGFPCPSEEAPIDTVLKFLEGALPFTAANPSITILGGEPMLRAAETLELARWAKKNGFEAHVSTNGLLVDEKFAKAAAACGLKVQVSIDGPTVFEHESLRGRDTFDRAGKTVRLLARHGVHVTTNMVVHEDNQWRLEDYFRFSRHLGASGVRFVPLRQIGGGNELRPPDLVKLLRSIRTTFALHRSFRKLASEDWFTSLASVCRKSERRATCGIGTRTLLVEADGSVYPCAGHVYPEFRLGTVKDSFRRLWTGSSMLNGLRRRFSVDNLNSRCAHCAVRYWCAGGCRGEAYARTGSCLEPCPACEDTKKAIVEMFWILADEESFVWDSSVPCSGK
jgi:radical SAM protein with 4Fe4S-binding SPASM domain